MSRRARAIQVEVVISIVAALLALITLVTRDWIEVVFRVDPDRGSGALEWAIVGALVFVSASTALLARWSMQRLRRATIATV